MNPLAEGFDLYNKFEESVFPQYAPIPQLVERMRAEGALAALMSGSGASVFSFFASEAEARRACKNLEAHVRWACVSSFFFPKLASTGATAL